MDTETTLKIRELRYRVLGALKLEDVPGGATLFPGRKGTTPIAMIYEYQMQYEKVLSQAESEFFMTLGLIEPEYVGGVRREVLDRVVNSGDFHIRVLHVCKRFSIRYIGELVQLSKEDLLAQPNFGQNSLRGLLRCLEAYGLTVGMNLKSGWSPPQRKT